MPVRNQLVVNQSPQVKQLNLFSLPFLMPDYAAIDARLDLADEAHFARDLAAKMRATVLKHAWDGEWFLRAYDFFGHKVGSHECEEGQIFIEPQGFCVMAGIGLEDGRARQALDAVEQRLATPHGIVLNNPAFSRYHTELGEISSYPPGYKENAGVFCHNNPWIMIAETAIGRGERALDYYQRTAPAYREELSEIHKMEPYAYSQMIAGKDAVRPGEAKNSWLTGTAAWSYVAIAHYILGVRAELDGLRVSPSLGTTLTDVKISRRCRGALYRITIRNNGAGQPRLKVNGKPIEGTLVPYARPGATVEIAVEC